MFLENLLCGVFTSAPEFLYLKVPCLPTEKKLLELVKKICTSIKFGLEHLNPGAGGTDESAVDEAEHDGDDCYHEEGGEEEPLEHDEPFQFLEARSKHIPHFHHLVASHLLPFWAHPSAHRKLWNPALKLRKLLLMLGLMEKQLRTWGHPHAFWPHIYLTWFSIASNGFEWLLFNASAKVPMLRRIRSSPSFQMVSWQILKKTHGLDFDEDPTDLILKMLKFSLQITAVNY